MKEFEILQLIESETLPTRSYRVPKKLMEALREAGKSIFGGGVEDTRVFFYFAAYGVMKWKEAQALRQINPSHEDILSGDLKKQIEEERQKNRGKKTGS